MMNFVIPCLQWKTKLKKLEEKLEIAKAMLEETPKLGLLKISKITVLSKRKIKKIKSEIKNNT